jgi:hypothetical protein
MKISGGRRAMNVDRAAELRDTGATWAEVGIRLAEEEGRSIPYTASSAENAVRKWKKFEETQKAYDR